MLVYVVFLFSRYIEGYFKYLYIYFCFDFFGDKDIKKEKKKKGIVK